MKTFTTIEYKTDDEKPRLNPCVGEWFRDRTTGSVYVLGLIHVTADERSYMLLCVDNGYAYTPRPSKTAIAAFGEDSQDFDRIDTVEITLR